MINVPTLSYNILTDKQFSDCYYVSTLMRCLAESLVTSAAPQQTFAMHPDDEDDLMQEAIEDEKFQKEAINELERYRRIDEWISSYQNIYSVTALECMRKLLQHGVVKNKKAEILQYTQSGNADEVRLAAWDALVQLNLARRPQILKYLLYSLCDDPSPYFRDQLLRVLGRALGTIALKTQEDAKPAPKPIEVGGLVLEQEEPLAVQPILQDALGKSPPELALIALKAALVNDEMFKAALWYVIQSSALAIPEVVSFLDIAALIYDAANGLVVHLRLPRFYTVTNLGKGKVQFKEKDKYRTTPVTGLGVDEFDLVQQHNLKYTGPLSRAAKDHIKTQKQEKQKLESQLAAAQELLSRQLDAQNTIQAQPLPRPSHVPSAAMSPPPLPVSTPGGSMKLTLKRKQSSTAEPRASSPKRPHLVQPATNGTVVTPKVEKSPSLNLGKINAQTPRVPSGASTPASAAPSRKPAASDKPGKAKVVRLKFTKQKRLQKILSQPPQPGYRPQKQKLNIPAKIKTSSSAQASPAPSAGGGSQARSGSNGDFFASPEVNTALSTGASVGAFRSWNGMSSIKKETDSAPMSAVSPMTTTHPGKSNGTATATGTMSPRPSEGGEEKKPKFKLKFGKKPTA
jgi:transcription initiation factor TFIID subunit 2